MKPVAVTDHAILRYAERAHGLEQEKIKEFLKKKVKPILGDGTYPIGDGYSAVVANNTIVTILHTEQIKGRRKKRFSAINKGKPKNRRPYERKKFDLDKEKK
jgi:hypothetical protein